MLDLLQKTIQQTIKSGIGQTILALGSWAFSLILLIVLIYYIFLSIVKFVFHKK